MKFPVFIAKRYLFSRKSYNIINIISGISIVGISVGTLALITVLSVFNGFEDLIVSLYSSYNPDIKVTAKIGKSFTPDQDKTIALENIEGVKYFTEVIEDNALIRYSDNQHIIILKGVNKDYGVYKGLDSLIIDGNFFTEKAGKEFAVVGAGVAYHVGMYLGDFIKPFSVYVPSKDFNPAGLNMEASFNEKEILPSGILSLHQEFDSKYIIVPLSFAAELFEYDNRISAIEIDLMDQEDIYLVQDKLKNIFGENFKIQNRFQQQELLYKIMKSEKWAIFIILTFILIVATFNMIGSLTMLIIDKKKDVAILSSMGANRKTIKRIFLTEGVMISFLGATTGLVLGALLCYLQIEFGLISLGGDSGSFIVEDYPVKLQWLDFIYVFLTVMLIGFLSALIPVRQISRSFTNLKIQ
ncbi:FtsX-like permease family protein [Bacteroidota bacterium]